MRVLKERSDCKGESCFSDVMASDLFLSLFHYHYYFIIMEILFNNFVIYYIYTIVNLTN